MKNTNSIRYNFLKERDLKTIRERVLARMSASQQPFDDISDEAKAERRAKAAKDKDYFQQTYTPHYLRNENNEQVADADFHRELFELADTKGTPVIIVGPRGFAKSVKVSIIDALHKIVNGERHFIIYISETEIQASGFLTILQTELESNERLRCDYGDLVGKEEWSATNFVTANGVKVLARGRGQRMRGLLHKNHRPDHVICDDYEDKKSSRNPRLVKEGIEYITETVIPGLGGRGGIYATFIFLGNLFSNKCIAAKILDNKDDFGGWEKRIYRAIIDEETRTVLWPQYFSWEILMRIKKNIGTVAFKQEFLLYPADEDSPFQKEWIRYYHQSELAGKDLITVMYGDPATREKSINDFKVWIIASMDISDLKIYVRFVYIKRCTINQYCRIPFAQHSIYQPRIIAYEDNAAQIYLKEIFENISRDERVILPFDNLTNVENKGDRILSLSPTIENGKILFLKNDPMTDVLIDQLIYYDGGKKTHDDGPDGLAGAKDLLNRIGIYANKIIKSRGKRETSKLLKKYADSETN